MRDKKRRTAAATAEFRRIREILSATRPDEIEAIRREADRVRERFCGAKVYLRGLVEFSNRCVNDCYYCGIRRSNTKIKRYCLSSTRILGAALWCARRGYGSLVLQSGECRTASFVSFVEEVVRTIKKQTSGAALPHGLGITLCAGEQTRETYQRWHEAGAHRYLLRIESSSPSIFARIHPPRQKLQTRIACLRTLKEIGYHLGTGVMIGLPGQTIDDLARDILFFKEIDADMIGMGPYRPHRDTPMAAYEAETAARHGDIFRLSLLMIAACRIVLRDVNIAATTALQAMTDDGREQGLMFGANVIMPQLTPADVKRNFLLYDGKPCLDEAADACRRCIEERIRRIGRGIGYDEWGDSPHFMRSAVIACRNVSVLNPSSRFLRPPPAGRGRKY